MRSLGMLLGLLLLLGIATTVEAQRVSIDYNRHANFAGYKTFSWIKRPYYRPDPLMEQRIVDAVNATLTSKGWQPVPEGGDVCIALHMTTREEHTLETLYSGFGGRRAWHFGSGFGTAIRTDHPYQVGGLLVDMFDGQSGQLIWRGVATEALSENPDKDTKKLERAAEKLFKGFPPK